jgi:diacylglycerol kinase
MFACETSTEKSESSNDVLKAVLKSPSLVLAVWKTESVFRLRYFQNCSFKNHFHWSDIDGMSWYVMVYHVMRIVAVTTRYRVV